MFAQKSGVLENTAVTFGRIGERKMYNFRMFSVKD